MYPADWHRIYGDKTGRSARAILPHLFKIFDVKTTFELGCGNAHWTQAGIDLGVTDYLVVDGPWNDRADLLVDESKFKEANLDEPFRGTRRFDMAICLEVAEHVSQGHASNVIDALTGASDVVLFGAAIPYQGGFGHINEQWPSWWRERFSERNYDGFDLIRPTFWHDETIHYWYRQNTYVYINRSNAELRERAAAAQARSYNDPFLIDAVHPEKFEEVASYRALSGSRLARRIPSWIASRIHARVAGILRGRP